MAAVLPRDTRLPKTLLDVGIKGGTAMPNPTVRHDESERARRQIRHALQESKTRAVPSVQTKDVGVPTSPCPWCAGPVERIARGGYVREFCSKAHKTCYNNALTKLSIAHARMLRTPGALKTWSLGGVNPWPRSNSVSEAPKRGE